MNIWFEKYRPTSIDDCVLPPRLKDSFKSIIDTGKLTHLLFHGPAGVGKTSVAKAIVRDLGLDSIVINASDDRNIDTLRTTIKGFAGSMSVDGKKRVVILDEADYLNKESTQAALRGVLEDYSSNCCFILTCNFKNRIIDPIHSRCAVHSFILSKQERLSVLYSAYNRCCFILDSEKVEYDKKALLDFIHAKFPDLRSIVQGLQSYSQTYGKIDSGILQVNSELDLSEIYLSLKNKKILQIRKWANENGKELSNFRLFYDTCERYIDRESLPKAYLIIADYQYKSGYCHDQEINMCACLIELMGYCKFL